MPNFPARKCAWHVLRGNASLTSKSSPKSSRPSPSSSSPALRPVKLLSKVEIENVFAQFEAHNPEPQGELYYTNSYTLLVAVILSAQATDRGVNLATKSLFAQVDSAQKMLDFSLENLKNAIKSIGLYHSKAAHIIATSEILVRDYNGEVPGSLAELIKLPGVGRKTANVVLNIAFGYPTIAVDTHVFRVSNRIGIACGETVTEVEKQLEKRIPSKYKRHAHHWLILHGRYICKARSPLCGECIIESLCPSSLLKPAHDLK